MTDTTERIGTYLRARRLPPIDGRSTWRWEILSNRGDLLGMVRWFASWRQYTFDPAPETTFNHACLTDLAAFLRRVCNERAE